MSTETPVSSSAYNGSLRRLFERFVTPTSMVVTGSVAPAPGPDWWRHAVVHGRDHEGKETAIPTETFFSRFHPQPGDANVQ
jgi:hypothetical protein